MNEEIFSVNLLDDWVEFNDTRRIKKRIVASQDFVSEILYYEPGQGTPKHVHPHEDEIFYVLEGSGYIGVGGQDYNARKGDFVYVPANEFHGLEADNGERFIVMLIRPGRKKQPRRKKAE